MFLVFIESKMKKTKERFESKLKKTNNCWEWQACLSKKGYGQFGICEEGKWKIVAAHRVAYMIFVGPVPGGMHVLHKCDNPSCVNPNHLFVGTNDDNVADRVSKGRSAVMVGHKNPRAKLTENDVRNIRQMLKYKVKSRSQIAKDYNVSYSTISHIDRRILWPHVV